MKLQLRLRFVRSEEGERVLLSDRVQKHRHWSLPKQYHLLVLTGKINNCRFCSVMIFFFFFQIRSRSNFTDRSRARNFEMVTTKITKQDLLFSFNKTKIKKVVLCWSVWQVWCWTFKRRWQNRNSFESRTCLFLFFENSIIFSTKTKFNCSITMILKHYRQRAYLQQYGKLKNPFDQLKANDKQKKTKKIGRRNLMNSWKKCNDKS